MIGLLVNLVPLVNHYTSMTSGKLRSLGLPEPLHAE